MSSFLNKNKFKNKYFRVAFGVLFFCVLLFGFFNFNRQYCHADLTSSQYGTRKILDSNSDFNNNVSAGSNLNPSNWIPNLLLEILRFFGWLVKGAVFLFEIAVNPDFFDKLFRDNGQAIFEMWKFIRDFLNIFFILILLFSAFATVFQVSKYHIKNIILWVVLMALLVNFSWPVTRVIIDLSNVTMYFMIDEMLADPNKTTAKIGALSNLSYIMVPEDYTKVAGTKDITYLFLAIVVVFIFGMTLLAYAGVLLIRVIVLVILLVFSPVGFVAAAFPSTSGYSKQWWDKLFKYAFNGPILIFMLIVAIKMMEAIGKSGIGENELKDLITQEGLKNNLNDMAQTIAFFAIPIMILWTALVTAGKAGDAGSAWVSNKVQGWSNNVHKWAPKYAGKMGHYTGRGVDMAVSGMSGGKYRPYAASRGYLKGLKEQAKYKVITQPEEAYKAKVEEAEALAKTKPLGSKRLGEKFGDKSAMQNLENKRVAEAKKKFKDDNTDFDSLVKIASDKSTKGARLRAAVEAITSHDQFAKLNSEQYSKIRNNFEMNSASFAGGEGMVNDLTAGLKAKANSKGKADIYLKHEAVKLRRKAQKINRSLPSTARKTDEQIAKDIAEKLNKDFISKMTASDIGNQSGLLEFFEKESQKAFQRGKTNFGDELAMILRNRFSDPVEKQEFIKKAKGARQSARNAGII